MKCLAHADRARARAVEDHAHLLDALAREFERVHERCAGNDRGAVLVVVEHRDLHRPAQFFLDQKTFRRLDVFQVDAAEGRLEQLAGADDLLRILCGDLDIEHVDVREPLEQHRLAFHHRLAGQRPDIAQTEDSSSVGDYRRPGFLWRCTYTPEPDRARWRGTAPRHPGVYARLKSRCVRQGLVARTAILPAGAAEWYSRASSSRSFMGSPQRPRMKPILYKRSDQRVVRDF